MYTKIYLWITANGYLLISFPNLRSILLSDIPLKCNCNYYNQLLFLNFSVNSYDWQTKLSQKGIKSFIYLILYKIYLTPSLNTRGFPCGSAGKESTCNARDLGLISGLGRSPGEGKGYPLQYSGLENSMDYTVHGVAKSQIWLSDFYFHFSKHKYTMYTYLSHTS